MAEKFAFKQLSGNGRRVDRHKRRSTAQTVLMQGSCHHFLAGTRFSGQKHRNVAVRQTTDRTKHLLHGSRLTDDFRTTYFTLFVKFACVRAFGHGAFFTCAAQQINRTVDVKRLGEILVGTALKGTHCAVQIAEGRHDDDGQSGILVLDERQQIEPAHVVHANITQQHRRRVTLKGLDHIGSRLEQAKRHLCTRERLFQHPANRTIIVNNPNLSHLSSFCPVN